MKTCSFGGPSWQIGEAKIIPLDSDWPVEKQHL